jgi:signal transduction histidine kinase
MAFNRLFKTTAFRLSAVYLLVIILASIAVGTYTGWKTNALLTQQLVEVITAEVKGLAEQYRQGGSSRLAATIATRSRKPGNSLYFFGTQTGRKIAGSLSRIPTELRGVNRGAQFSYIWQQDETREKRNAVGIPFRVDGGLVLIVGRDIEDQLNFIYTARKMFFIGLGLLAAFGLGTGLWVSRNLLNRINQISETSKSIMAGDLSERIPINGSNDELDQLSANLNNMLMKIETLMSGMREVTDNIAHDLKTPINRIRIKAEEALIDPEGEQAKVEALQGTIEEADNLIKTFNALLKIARLEAGADNEQKDVVDLSQVMEEVAELYEPVIDDEGMELKLSISENLTILADRQLISQAITNVIDNALKYGRGDPKNTNHKTIIELMVRQNHQYVEIHIADNGEGISKENKKRVFRRFVRLEESRSKPGSGLGLSMVGAVINAYKGAIRLEDNEPGLRIIMRFPIHPIPQLASA